MQTSVQALFQALSALLPPGRLTLTAPMSEHTTLKIGGPADLLAQPASREELRLILSRAAEAGCPVTVIGNGSNLLVRDGGIRGLVVKIGPEMGAVTANGRMLHAQAGALLSAVSREAAKRSLAGLAFAAGIPGTIGGGTYMNAGAYGGELCQVIARVEGMDEEGNPFAYSGEEMGFGYRRSRAQTEKLYITDVFVDLKPGNEEAILQEMAELNARRREKQPLTVPSAGSTFKRPAGYYAGTLIDQCGLKGARVGGAAVSEKHAGFLVNDRSATAADFLSLIALVQKVVKEKAGVSLTPEVRILGEEVGAILV